MITISIQNSLAEEIKLALQGSSAEKIIIGNQTLLKEESGEQVAAALEKIPMGTFVSPSGVAYILYNI
jgi:hypothetical protein